MVLMRFQPLSKDSFEALGCRLLSLGADMRRRKFISLLGGAAAAWPVVARAQQAKRVGVLDLGNVDAQSFRTELREGLRKSGYAEGQNIDYAFRSAETNASLLPMLAAELVALKVDVLVALYTPCALAAQQATREIPIVTLSGDPVGLGLVASLSRPGGNITGIDMMGAALHGKCVELFRDMLPSVRRIAAVGNAADPFSKPFMEQVRLAGKTTGIEIAPEITVRTQDEIDAAFSAVKKEMADAAVVQASLSTQHLVNLAFKHRLPAATVSRSFAEFGGLMSYGVDGPNAFRLSSVFVKKILQGSKPADLPVEQPTKFELVINLKTAKALGLTIPPVLLARADDVIE
jgi:putative tryptophan/tyrosine transport system substrate-binding protein